MKTLFVDTDDTLVLFSSSPTPYGVIRGIPYKPNTQLIERMSKFDGHIIVWSGGGRDYAREVAVKVIPETIRYSVETKWIDKNINSGDIIVDDQPEYFEALKEIGVIVVNPFDGWDS